MTGTWMVFDVESAGLHGAPFAVGYVVVGADGAEKESGLAHCPLEAGGVPAETLAWLEANVVLPDLRPLADADALAEWFWERWRRCKAAGSLLAADVPWPVEARFLARCIDIDRPAREWQGPYPLIDVASVRLAAGLDPLGTEDRQPDELPAHNPLCDARQSARLLLEAMQLLRARKEV